MLPSLWDATHAPRAAGRGRRRTRAAAHRDAGRRGVRGRPGPGRPARPAPGADPAVRRAGHRPAAARPRRAGPDHPAAVAGGRWPGRADADRPRHGRRPDRRARRGRRRLPGQAVRPGRAERPGARAVPAAPPTPPRRCGSAPACSTCALRDAVLPDGARVALSAREFELLRVLAARPQTVHPRAELRSRVFDEAAARVDRRHLRVLPAAQARPPVVRTVHGLGYRLGVL